MNRRRRDHSPECVPLHHGHSGDGRSRTGGFSPDKRALYATELRPHRRSRGRDSNPWSRAHEAREDNRSSTAQGKVWLAGVEPAIPGFQGRWGGQLPHSQKNRIDAGVLVGGRVYLLAFSLAGPGSTPYRESTSAPKSSIASTLGGTRTRSLRVEGPASSPASTTRACKYSGGRDRTCALAGNNRVSFQLDHTGLGQAEATGLEPASGGGRLRDSNAQPYQLGHASRKAEGEGVEPPRPARADPLSGRDTAPMAVLPSSGPGRGRTCTLPVKSRELCRVLSYGAVVM